MKKRDKTSKIKMVNYKVIYVHKLMVRQGNMMDINNLKLRENLSKVKFQLKDKELFWGDYENINSEIFFSPQQTGKRNRIIIHPGGELLIIISIIISALNDYIRNMIDPSNNIIAHLIDGDIVEINGFRARYRGLQNEKIRLEYADGTVYLPIDQSYKMIRYNGSAATINKMPTKKGTKAKVTKNVVSSIFNIDTREFSNIIKYSVVFVAPKDRIYEMIRSLKIVYKNKKYDITSIFPFAYYSSSEHQLDFAGNATKIEPIIKFASKISVARDLIQDNKDIKSAIILGEESYRSNLTDLDWIFKRHSIDDINIILEWGKITTIEGLLENIENLEIYAWSKNAILNRINLYEDKNYPKKISSKTLIQDKIINNFVNKRVEVKSIEISGDLQDKLKETRKFLKEISYNVVLDDKKDEFLKLSYTLINLYEKSCFPIKALESMIDEEQLIAVHPQQTIERLNELTLYLELYTFDSATINKVKDIINNLIWLRGQLYEKNPKWDELLRLFRVIQLKKFALVLYKGYFIDVLKRYFALNRIPLSFGMFTINKFDPEKTYDEIIIPGVYQSKNYDFINNSYTEKVKILAYSGEVNLYAWINRKNKHILNRIDKKNLLTEYSEEESTDEIDVICEDEVKDLIAIEDVINEIIRKQGAFEGNFSGSGSKVECVKMVIFESGEKAYFSRYFSPSLLDRDAEEIKDIKIEELSIGDELVFRRDERNVDKDIIQVIIEKLLENGDFNLQYNGSLILSRYWKSVLENFMKETKCTEYYISSELSNYGVVRSPMAVSTWLRSNKTTAPDKEEVYYALANITKDKLFIDKWKEICDACAAIRSLQTRLKRYLGRCIVKSVVKETKTDFDRIVESCVGDVAKLAQIVQIEQLYDIHIEVPVYMTNKLIET